MSIQVEPLELAFERPFNREVTQTLHIKNMHFEPVAFKVKTTAPKQYCVRPNSGRIEAGKEVEVQVHLQPMKEDPPADFKCRDKFLVQSVAISADREPINIQHIWPQVEKTDRSAIHENKIRVVFLQPGEAKTRMITPAFTEDTEARAMDPFDTPAQARSSREQGGSTPNAPVGPVSKPASKPPSTYSQSTYSLNQQTEGGDDELAAAKARIARLEDQLRESQQKLQTAVGSAKNTVEQAAQGAVTVAQKAPPKMVVPVWLCAILILFVGLISRYYV